MRRAAAGCRRISVVRVNATSRNRAKGRGIDLDVNVKGPAGARSGRAGQERSTTSPHFATRCTIVPRHCQNFCGQALLRRLCLAVARAWAATPSTRGRGPHPGPHPRRTPGYRRDTAYFRRVRVPEGLSARRGMTSRRRARGVAILGVRSRAKTFRTGSRPGAPRRAGSARGATGSTGRGR